MFSLEFTGIKHEDPMFKSAKNGFAKNFMSFNALKIRKTEFQ